MSASANAAESSALADPDRRAFRQRAGQDIRSMREQVGITQERLGSAFGWNRDAISKIESGKREMSLYDYCRFLVCMRDAAPLHPGLPLAEFLLAKRPGKPRLVIK